MSVAVSILALPLTASPIAPGNVADAVWGQADFTHNGINFLLGSGLNAPSGVAIDSATVPGHVLVYVVDSANNRVLGFVDPSPLGDGTPASIVIGQPDFKSWRCNDGTAANEIGGLGADSLCQPTAAAVDGSGDLYVADTGNNRVLEYNSPFAAGVIGGLAANAVFGQVAPGGNFTSALCSDGRNGDPSPTAIGLCQPSGVALDAAGNLYVADTANSRVLEYNTPFSQTSTTGSGDTIADLVFGQSTASDFADNFCNGSSGTPGAATLCAPTALAVDAGNNLYVVDAKNNRVLEYNTPLAVTGTAGSGDTTADLVLGQSTPSDFADNFCNGALGTPSATTLCAPGGVALDSGNNLYVADNGNNRVLEYNTPLAVTSAPGSGDATADLAFGQSTPSDFADHSCNGASGISTATSLCGPVGLGLDLNNNLYAADSGNQRLLKYNSPLAATAVAGSGDTVADVVLGEIDFSHTGVNNLGVRGVRGLYQPGAIAVDGSTSPARVYLADTDNSRVLGWKSAASFAAHSPPDLLIGQPDFNSAACNNGTSSKDVHGLGADSLCHPAGLAVDSAGNLYVADADNNRVLEYTTPFAGCVVAPCSGPPANVVFGQDDQFTVNTCSLGPDHLCSPNAVAIDGAGNVFIADKGSNRVLEYNTPLVTTTTPGSGDTLSDSVFGQPDFRTSLCSNGASVSPSDASSPTPTPTATPTAAPTATPTVTPVASPTPSATPTPTINPPPSAGGLCGPSGVALDALGNLYVADALNNRVLEYDTPLAKPKTPNLVADRVFGQGSRTQNLCNGSSGTPDASTLCLPSGVALDAAGNLSVADSGNNRVLLYSAPLSSRRAIAADSVLGQGGLFTANQCNDGQSPGDAQGLGSDSLCAPSGIALDKAGNLYVADTANNRALEYFQLASPAPALSVRSTTVDFGNAPESHTQSSTVTQNLTLSNPQRQKPNVPIRIEAVSLLTVGDFKVKRPGCPTTLEPGRSCTITLAFSPLPNVLGPRQGSLTIVSSASNSPQVVSLKGNSVAGTVAAATNTSVLNFSRLKVGRTSASKSVTLTNRGSVDIGISSVAVTGIDQVDFKIARNHCPSVLAPKEGCPVSVEFNPQAAGPLTADLTFTDDAGQQQVTLSGFGR